VGTVWKVNFFRMDMPAGKAQQGTAWSPPMVGDFHALDKFGELVFADANGVVPPPSPAPLAKLTPKPGPLAPAPTPGPDRKTATAQKGPAPDKKK
jgi:hypothetical protein